MYYYYIMSETFRKIPEKYDNPVDNIILNIVEKLNPIFNQLGFSPNGITTLSLLMGILFLYNYNKNNYLLAGSFFGASYFFDCMDGNYARTYKMESKFGDIYDHVKDILVVLVFFYLFIKKKISTQFKLIFFSIITFFYFLMCIHMNYTEVYIEKNTEHKNSLLQDIFCYFLDCTNTNTEKELEKYRYAGCGTFNLILVLCIFSHLFLKTKS